MIRPILAAVGVIAVATTWGMVVAHQRMKAHGQDQIVECAIRQLSAAADQYFLENGGSTVALSNLVGPAKYIHGMETVANETYPAYYTQGAPIRVTGVAGLRTITYVP